MSIEVGTLIAVCGLLLSLLTFTFNKNKATKQETYKDATIHAQLEHIGKGVDDIRIDLKAEQKERANLSERVTRVEESSKQAHKRIDKLTNNNKGA